MTHKAIALLASLALALSGASIVVVWVNADKVSSVCKVQNAGLRAKDDQVTVFKQIAYLLSLSSTSKTTISASTLKHFTTLESALNDYVSIESAQPEPKNRVC